MANKSAHPAFANIFSSKRLNRFSLRGINRAHAQRRFFSLIHNVEAWITHCTTAARSYDVAAIVIVEESHSSI